MVADIFPNSSPFIPTLRPYSGRIIFVCLFQLCVIFIFCWHVPIKGNFLYARKRLFIIFPMIVDNFSFITQAMYATVPYLGCVVSVSLFQLCVMFVFCWHVPVKRDFLYAKEMFSSIFPCGILRRWPLPQVEDFMHQGIFVSKNQPATLRL